MQGRRAASAAQLLFLQLNVVALLPNAAWGRDLAFASFRGLKHDAAASHPLPKAAVTQLHTTFGEEAVADQLGVLFEGLSSSSRNFFDNLEQELGRAAAVFLAFVVGCVCSFSAARADVSSEEATVEAAWGFIQRNYYERSFHGQNWDDAHQRYLARVRNGESAKNLTREMVGSLSDKYSRVIDADAFEKLMAYDPLGVGLVLARSEDKSVVVSSPPFAGSAAARAGIRQGDVVDAVDGIAFAKEPMLSVMDRVARADAPKVTLSLRRVGRAEGEAWEESLARVRTTSPQNEITAGVAPAAASGHRVGFLRMRNFGSRSAIDLGTAIDKVRAEGADELVLDLRGNTGGSFQAALEVASLFLEPGSVANRVTKAGGGGSAASGDAARGVGEQLLLVTGNKGATSAPVREPLAVLVDEGSASASEVLASALRGNCRAPLLGSKTFGKAAVQAVFGLPNREAMALTVAKYSGPDGRTIDGGMLPDGPGPEGPLARLAGAARLPVSLTPEDYGRVEFGSGGAWDALRECRAPDSPAAARTT